MRVFQHDSRFTCQAVEVITWRTRHQNRRQFVSINLLNTRQNAVFLLQKTHIKGDVVRNDWRFADKG